jgi:hypothetical protein
MEPHVPLVLDAPSARLGETVSGVLVLLLPEAEVDLLARLTVSLRGRLDYKDHDGDPCVEKLSAGTPLVQEGPFENRSRVPFTLTLPKEAPPSYQGRDVRVQWEVVASLEGPSGKPRREWSQLLQLECARTHLTPELTEPRPPAPSDAYSFWHVGCLVLGVSGCCLLPSVLTLGVMLSAEEAYSLLQQSFIGIFIAVALGFGLIGAWVIFVQGQTMAKFRYYRLAPRAARFPIGGRARLRVFLDARKEFTVHGATLKLVSEEGLSDFRSFEVPIEFPSHLAVGAHQLDVQIPIPREFPPTYGRHLSTRCTLRIRLGRKESLSFSTKLELAPEVLDEEEAPAPPEG